MTKNYLRVIKQKNEISGVKLEEKYSIEETKAIRNGIAALFIILTAVFITVSHNVSIKGKSLGKTYNIYADFGRTDGLNVGDAVRLAGVNIGRVVAADLDENFRSRLTLEIGNEYKIPEDSSASIVSFGLIGGKYVEIDVGGAEEYIAPEGIISYTQDAMVLEELLDRIISIGKHKKVKTPDNTISETSDNTVSEIKGEHNE